LEENRGVGDGELARRDRSAALVEFVCLAKHKVDSLNADGYTVTTRGEMTGYCARGADQNHEWIRVPPTPLNEITIGNMEDRPPEPVYRRDRMASHPI
jgi:hypothetical protein